MDSASFSVEVNSYVFLPEMNYPLRELYRINNSLGTYDVIPAIAQSYSYKYILPSTYMEAMENTFKIFANIVSNRRKNSSNLMTMKQEILGIW